MTSGELGQLPSSFSPDSNVACRLAWLALQHRCARVFTDALIASGL